MTIGNITVNRSAGVPQGVRMGEAVQIGAISPGHGGRPPLRGSVCKVQNILIYGALQFVIDFEDMCTSWNTDSDTWGSWQLEGIGGIGTIRRPEP